MSDKSYYIKARRMSIIHLYYFNWEFDKKKGRREDITTTPYKKNNETIRKAAVH